MIYASFHGLPCLICGFTVLFVHLLCGRLRVLHKGKLTEQDAAGHHAVELGDHLRRLALVDRQAAGEDHADLFRIKGVGPQFAELLEAAGVDTVKELRHRVAANLKAKMEEVNAEKNLVNRVPSESELQKMIDQAKEMEVTMTY
mgnify:CR=1 FL=1